MYGNQFGTYPFMAPQMGQSAPFIPQMPQPMQTTAQPVQNAPAFLQVGTAKEFDSVTIQPGRQALIMAQNDPYLAFKSADQMGKVTTSFYRLEPVTQEQITGPVVEYATKGELTQLQDIVQQLINGLGKTKEATEK